MYREISKADSKVERPSNPRCNANILEIITYSWISNLLKIGRRRDLNEIDLYTTLDKHTSSPLGDKLEKIWRSELANAYLMNRKPALWRALIRMFGTKFMFLGFVICINEIIITISQPILIGKLLEYFNPDNSENSDIRHAYICASGLVISLLITTVVRFLTQQDLMDEALKARVASSSLIYKKALYLSNKALGKTTVGQMITLISNDVNQFDVIFHKLHFLWIGPLQTIVVTYFLWQEIGVSSLIGIAFFFVFIPLQGLMGKKKSKIHLKIVKKTDERIRLMNEIILGIQVIKMYTWEKPFSKLIEYVRKLEVEQFKGSTFIGFISLSFKVFQTRFQLFVSIVLYILLGNHISVHKLYVLTTMYNILHMAMVVLFSVGLLKIGECIVSIKRIENFLLLEEKDQIPVLKRYSKSNTVEENYVNKLLIADDNIPKTCKDFKNNTEFYDNYSLVLLNVTAKWTNNHKNNTLEKINLTVRPGQLFAVIGTVGAGKSSLLQAILRELPISEGRISAHGVISYASQEPWIFSGTIQQNILFGSPMDEERFKQVIDICALKSDLEHFPLGDETIVGERGITLSGGQKARINLARAVYKKADIYLLDDPLSAVDVRVGNHLFEKCILDYLKLNTCILITHQIQHLSEVDQIVLMDNGNIVTVGSYQDLKGSSFDFIKLLGSSEGIYIENEFENNNIKNDGIDSNLVSTLHGSNNNVTSSKYTNQISDDHTSKLNDKSLLQSNEYNCKNAFIAYIMAGGNTLSILFCLFMCICTQVLTTGGDLWLSFWVNQEIYECDKLLNTSHSNDTSMSGDSYSISLLSNFQLNNITVYVFLMVAMILSAIVRSASFVKMTTNASMNLHNRMFNSTIRTTMFFFNTNTSGQILTRFSKDMEAVDKILPDTFLDAFQILLFNIATIFIVGYTNIYLLIPTFIVVIIIYKLRFLYFNTSQSIKRLEGATRSPVLAHMNASLQGLTTIRAFKVENILSQEFDKHQDLHSSASHLCTCLIQGFGFWLDIICIIYISIVIFTLLVIGNNVYGGIIGLALTQMMGLLGKIQWGIRQSTILESQMVPVKRILEYTHLSLEDSNQSTNVKSPPKEWPYSGKIVFKDFNLRYSLNSPNVLKDINIEIRSMEKIGIVGRTGAGKSSFIGALFRLALNEGKIIIDGVDIHELVLKDLRSKLSIIPQEPVLFSGTIRTNLDPFDEYPDHALWNALDEVELKNFVEDLPGGLNSKMSNSGSNFSVGQRQLVCLARAILQNNKILILDEATANVDPLTDKLIQNTIRNKFKNCTVLTIAHRINTIMDSNRVLVMDFGKIVEFDHPNNLLKNTDGFFYKMVEQTGKDTAYYLHSLASQSYTTVQLIKKSPSN